MPADVDISVKSMTSSLAIALVLITSGKPREQTCFLWRGTVGQHGQHALPFQVSSVWLAQCLTTITHPYLDEATGDPMGWQWLNHAFFHLSLMNSRICRQRYVCRATSPGSFSAGGSSHDRFASADPLNSWCDVSAAAAASRMNTVPETWASNLNKQP